jgi:O-antigen ligase
MIGGAIRAWHSSPVWGIEPGMHQNLWPHFSASADGDREKGIWPSLTNDEFHSYEVHSDWVQLLEEYGIAGFVLFLVPLTVAASIYRGGFGRARRVWVEHRLGESPGPDFGIMLAGFLALIAMGFHSLGDFNLQMPATTWLLAALVTLGLVEGEKRG